MMDYFFHDFTSLQLTVLMIAAVLIGINKTGLPGLGLLPVVMLANTFPVGMSTGLQLGMLAMADLPAAWYYRKTVNWKQLMRLIPMALLGILCGHFVLHFIKSDWTLNLLIGSLILALCVFGLVKDYVLKDKEKIPTHWAFAAFFGLLAGFTTQVANAAGPVMAIYLIAMRFEKKEYMGTAAWYFLILNWTKVPIFAYEGRITAASIRADLGMIPLILVGAAIGIWMLKKMPQKIFEKVVLALAAVAAIKLLSKLFM